MTHSSECNMNSDWDGWSDDRFDLDDDGDGVPDAIDASPLIPQNH